MTTNIKSAYIICIYLLCTFFAAAQQNDTSVIVIAYRNAVINPLPIDRPFNILVTNIDTGIKNVNVMIYEIETRPKRYKHNSINARNHISFTIFKSLKLIDSIPCTGGGVDTKNNQENFITSANLIPNNNYVISITPIDSVTPLTKYQQAQLAVYLKSQFLTDPVLRNYINGTLQKYYDTTDASYMLLTQSSRANFNYIRSVIVKYNPNLALDNDFIKKMEVEESSFIKNDVTKVRNIKEKILSLIELDSTYGLQDKASFIAVQSTFAKYDWIGLSDTAVKEKLHKQIAFKSLPANNDSNTIKQDVDDINDMIDSISPLTDSIIDVVINQFIIPNTYTLSLNYSYFLDITKNAKTNVTFDVGGAFAPSIGQWFAYSAINIYFRPIDKNLPPRNTNYTIKDFFATRFSFMTGISVSPVDKVGERKGIVGNKGLVFGTSFRCLSWFKVNGGVVSYCAKDTNPLISSYKPGFSPFISVSLDIDIKPLFSSVPLLNNLIFTQ